MVSSVLKDCRFDVKWFYVVFDKFDSVQKTESLQLFSPSNWSRQMIIPNVKTMRPNLYAIKNDAECRHQMTFMCEGFYPFSLFLWISQLLSNKARKLGRHSAPSQRKFRKRDSFFIYLHFLQVRSRALQEIKMFIVNSVITILF